MDMKKLFRRSFLGGFNKKDVENYIQTLEEELEKAQGEKKIGLSEEDKKIIDESIVEIVNLKKEREELEQQIIELKTQLNTQKTQKNVVEISESENSELVFQLIKENKELKEKLQSKQESIHKKDETKDAIRKVLLDAKKQADTIILNAEKDAEERKKKADQELRTQLANKVIDFATSNYRLKDFTSGIDSICEQLKNVSDSMKNISRDVPAQVIELLDEADKKIVDAQYTKRDK